MAETESDNNVSLFPPPSDNNCYSSSSDQNLKKEDIMYKRSIKRKLEVEEDTRNNKYRRSSEEDDEKENARLVKNRESAQLSRRRKKHYVLELEDKLKNLHSTVTDLNCKVSYFMAENATLRHQVGSGKPPFVPLAYPWMPCPAYMVPIPRFKPQQSVTKVKRAASVSILGVLFCLFLFGALAPFVRIGSGQYKSKAENSVPCESSEPLVASLFVPRDEKLVKIDGDLIVHSVISRETSEMKIDVRMQQWFREGVTGPMFGSGMCTEVFQFDVSSNSGVINPASQQPKNIYKGKTSRRILRGGLSVSDFNLTKDHNNSSKENFRETKLDPSMVVSVLVDPIEGSYSGTGGTMGGMKSLSRVFVVVLVDGVKYVTYSCNLPQLEVPHLVTS